MKQTPEDVIEFWENAGPTLWFKGGDAFDEQCRASFLDLHMAAARGELSDWVNSANGALALLLLLDQIPRNIFRGSAHIYATDPLALHIANQAIALGHDRQFDPSLRGFFYMPYMHSEALADQQRCVALFQEVPEAESGKWATHHCGIIEQFGRFPHRNQLLGRESTPEELAWLKDGGFQG